jgi:hypothetical protein
MDYGTMGFNAAFTRAPQFFTAVFEELEKKMAKVLRVVETRQGKKS